MQAAVITASRRLEVVSTSTPAPAAGEVRVRLEGCGICASNLPVWEGREWFTYPLDPGAPGHEGWGVVDAVGDGVENVRAGERVAFLSNHAYAEYDVAGSDALVRIPDSFTRFPGEALGCAMNIFRRSEVSASDTVAIIGAGFLGNLLVQLCKSAGARVVALSRRESARELARACGADETLSLDEAWKAGKVSRVIECVGTQEPLDIATNLIAERGRLIIAGYHQDGPRRIDMQQWNWLGIDVVNAHERDPRQYVRGMEEAVSAVLSGTLDPSPLLTHAYALDGLGRALDNVEQRPDGFVKGVVLL